MKAEIFDYAEIDCSDDYIMAPETMQWEEALDLLDDEFDLILEKFIFKPITSQIRITCHHAHGPNLIFNVQSAPVPFLRALWELDIDDLNNAIRTYILHSDIKAQYVEGRPEHTADGTEMVPLPEDDRKWLMTTLLGARA